MSHWARTGWATRPTTRSGCLTVRAPSPLARATRWQSAATAPCGPGAKASASNRAGCRWRPWPWLPATRGRLHCALTAALCNGTVAPGRVGCGWFEWSHRADSIRASRGELRLGRCQSIVSGWPDRADFVGPRWIDDFNEINDLGDFEVRRVPAKSRFLGLIILWSLVRAQHGLPVLLVFLRTFTDLQELFSVRRFRARPVRANAAPCAAPSGPRPSLR